MVIIPLGALYICVGATLRVAPTYHLFPQMAVRANPFEVGAADEAVVIEGVAVDARLVQRGQVCAERVAAGESPRVDDGTQAGIGWEFAAQGADAIG